MRLSAATLDRLPDEVGRPGYDRDSQRVGIVHLGVGAFHRAHQAVVADRAMAAGERDWAIVGASLRSASARTALAPQNGLYTVTEKGARGTQSRLIGAVREVIVAPEASDDLRRALASPDVAIVTLTVTEKGYHRRADGSLDIDVVEQMQGTIYHHLARAFADRREAGHGGVTLLSCDNLADNGGALAASLATWLDHADPALATWFAAECTCPSTMVDRIVPATTPSDLDAIALRLGMRDEAAVVTESFLQWVIEDRFAGRRPRWEGAGVRFVSDVAPYETAKLRMLNGAHSALAYLGLLAGLTHVHEAIAHPAIGPVVEQLMRDEAAASFDPAPGQNLADYAGALLGRFANSALPHALAQIAIDGSQKIPQRWLAPLGANAARNRSCPATLRGLAAWLIHVRGDKRRVDDPRADELAALWVSAGRDGIVDALFGDRGLFADVWRPRDEDKDVLMRTLADLA